MRGRPAICGPGATMPEHPIPQTLLWTGGAKYLCLKKDEKSKDILYLTKQVTDILMQGSENVPANNLKPPNKPEILPSFQKHLPTCPGSGKTQQTTNFSRVHCYGSPKQNPLQFSRQSRVPPSRLYLTPRCGFQCGTVCGVVWYSNDRMEPGLGLLLGTAPAPNGAPPPPATLPPRLAHPPHATTLLFYDDTKICYIATPLQPVDYRAQKVTFLDA